MTKKTYREPEKNLRDNKRKLIIYITAFLGSLIVLIIVISIITNELHQKSQEYQEKTGVWFLRVHCDYDSTEWITVYKFNSYSLYKGFLKNYEEHWNKENCKIIQNAKRK